MAVAEKSHVAVLELHRPWWLHPAWALLLVVTSTAVVSIGLTEESYEIWSTEKYLDHERSTKILLGNVLMLLGIVLAQLGGLPRSPAVLRFGPGSLRRLLYVYRVLFALTIFGYCAWVAIAVAGGARPETLLAILQREPGAISQLKAQSVPVAGVTTPVQFGPVVVVLGYVLRKVGVAGRWYWAVVLLASGRVVFYAERLAFLEVIVPLVLIASITMDPASRWRPVTSLAPLFFAPLVWSVFAVSEYTRSWVFHQNYVDVPFVEWVTLRLFGYYVTSYNNSGLFDASYNNIYGPPYVSIPGLWNTPGFGKLVDAPSFHGYSAAVWWESALESGANPEFTNPGSFLVTYAEMGWLMASVFWIVVGWLIGQAFASLARGSVVGLVAYCCAFIGIPELPRFVYWTEGRAVPMLVAVVIIAWVLRGWGRSTDPPLRRS